MIKIKLFGGNWRFEIDNEEWEFKTLEDMEECLKKILDFKNNFGNLK